jgi:hypothetical protein
MVYFNDRRPRHHVPTEEDYRTPLTRTMVTEANKRFRNSGVPEVIHSNQKKADKIVNEATKKRFKSRRRSGQDFQSVGEYLEFLNEIAKQDI